MLLLRALVPAGFMLASIDGGLAVVLCDADATASLYRHAGNAMSAAAMSGHAMSDGAMSGAAMSGSAMSAAEMAGHDLSMAGMHDLSMAGRGSHDMSGHPGGHTHPDPTCPYAQSSGATPIPFVAPLTPAIESAPPVLPEPAAQIYAHFGPTRQQSPRGPPHLA
jgi:hypothetical protein